MSDTRLRIPDALKEETPTNNTIFFHRKKPGRADSFIEENDAYGQISEIYFPTKNLGRGYNGLTRLFAGRKDSSKQVVVKQMTTDPEYLNEPTTQKEVDEYIVNMNKGYSCFAEIYPDATPRSIKHFIDESGKYDYRDVTPYLGITIAEYANESIHTAEDFALFVLKVAEAIAFVHSRGKYHGDASWANILARPGTSHEFGLACPDIHLIDFDKAGKIGQQQNVFTFISGTEVAPTIIDEITDITYFKDSMFHCMKTFAKKHPDQLEKLKQNFPRIHEFIELNDEAVKTFDSQTLNKAIPIFRNNLRAWHANKSSPGTQGLFSLKNSLLLAAAALVVGVAGVAICTRSSNNNS